MYVVLVFIVFSLEIFRVMLIPVGQSELLHSYKVS